MTTKTTDSIVTVAGGWSLFSGLHSNLHLHISHVLAMDCGAVHLLPAAGGSSLLAAVM